MSTQSGIRIPNVACPADVTPEWLTGVLRNAGYDATVASLSATRIGTGLIGENFRFNLHYGDASGRPDGAPGAPASLVGKFQSTEETSRATGVNWGYYAREVNFYRHLATGAGIRVPKCFHAGIDPVTGEFALLLEDLAPAVQGDQLKGVTLEEAKRVLDEAARLHAAHWGDAALDALPWVIGAKAAPISLTQEKISTAWAKFHQRYANRIKPHCVDIGEAICRHFNFIRFGYTGPRCLTHNDFRPDNMMFGTAAGGAPLTTVDWQTAGFGCCMADVSYFLGGALPRELRCKHEQSLLMGYHRKLSELGVTAYSFDDVKTHYARYSFSPFFGTVIAAVMVQQTPRGDEMFFTMLEGAANHILDVGALSLLPA